MKTNPTVSWAFMTFFLAASISVAASAQQSPYVVGSTVTGHVYCADTNAPAPDVNFGEAVKGIFDAGSGAKQ